MGAWGRNNAVANLVSTGNATRRFAWKEWAALEYHELWYACWIIEWIINGQFLSNSTSYPKKERVD